MKLKIFTYVFLLSISFTNIFAQSKTDSTNLLIFKKHSMQFRVSNYLSLSSFKGTLLSYKYHFSDRNAFRLGLDFDSKIDDNDQNYDYFGNDTSIKRKTLKNTYYDFLVVGEYLFYANPSNELKLFLGIGPQILLYKSGEKTDKIFYSDTLASYAYDKKDVRNIYEFGISSVYGMEWFFRSNMSLHAEYSFSMVYFLRSGRTHRILVSRPSDSESLTKIGYDDKGVIFRSNIVRFGLSVYF